MQLVFIFACFQFIGAIIWNNSTIQTPKNTAGAAVGVDKYHSKIFLFGGSWNANYSTTVYQFDQYEFTKVNTAPHIAYGSATTINDVIYIKDVEGTTASIARFNTTSLEWLDSILMPLNGQANNGAMCFTNNNTHLFIIGGIECRRWGTGQCNPGLCSQLLIYNTINESWYPYNNIANTSRMTFISCGYYNDKIYAFGGERNCNFAYTNNIVRYDIINNDWTILDAHLSSNRTDTLSISPNHDGIMYIIGGINPAIHGTVEIFDANNETIKPATSLNTKRTAFSVGFVDGKIYVMGGEGQFGEWLRSIEVSNVIPTAHPTKSPTVEPTVEPTNSEKQTKSDILTITMITLGSIIFLSILVISSIYCKRRLNQRNDENAGLIHNNSNYNIPWRP